MAATAATQFTITPLAGIDLDNKASAANFGFAALTPVFANDGRKHTVAIAQGTLGSTANLTIGASGSATSAASAGVANSYTTNVSGGVVVGQYFWARSNTI